MIKKPVKNGKRGQIIAENTIFIVLNLVFLSILIIFIYSKLNSTGLVEDKYSKQIALIIDSAKPGMTIHLNMEDAIKIAKDNSQDLSKIVSVSGNVVNVKLEDKSARSYYFFNNVKVSVYPDTSQNPLKDYVIKVDSYNK